MKTSDFDFDLPPERIAQHAAEPRDHARLLQVTPRGLANAYIYDLPDLLRPGDLLVINDTRVIPARLFGKRHKGRGEMRVEVLLHKPQASMIWSAFAKPGKRLRVGDILIFAPDLQAELIEKREGGEVVLTFDGEAATFMQRLQRYGEPPLPPYIKREAGAAKQDAGRYQTVYAVRDGAIAAPTAGLHFTPELLEKLRGKGIDTVAVTLHVGAGTFLPVKVEDLSLHQMHAEWGEVSAAAAHEINQARQAGRRIVCVGTTSLRVLESAADADGTVHAFAQDTSIFITPGYRFRATNALLTNFHLPQSTLFMLVSAFMGLDCMRAAYDYAIHHQYRFYSFGDACLLEPS